MPTSRSARRARFHPRQPRDTHVLPLHHHNLTERSKPVTAAGDASGELVGLWQCSATKHVPLSFHVAYGDASGLSYDHTTTSLGNRIHAQILSTLSFELEKRGRKSMDALDQLVTQVQALSGSEQDVVHLSTVLKQADELLHTYALRLDYALAALSFDVASARLHRPRTFSRIPFAFSHPRRSRRLACGFRWHVNLVFLPELARARCCRRS
jgi:hypothetical protein